MRILTIVLLVVALASCEKPSDNTLIIGTIAGPETELIEVAKEVAQKKYGLRIKVVEFSDYNLPNEALQDGSLDANVYQHLPYLQSAIKAHGYSLEVIGKTFVYPMALYSKKFHTLKALPDKATVAIPNDPSNEARALLLLEKAGLITLKDTHTATPFDIDSNPHKLQIKELDAAQLPRILNDVDGAVINTTFAMPAGLSIKKDTLLIEGKDSPYANIIVIHQNSPKKPALEQFVKAFQSQEVKDKAKQLFGDSAIPAW